MRGAQIVRYMCYLATSLRVQSYRSWRAEGEPNPFVAFENRRRRTTNRQELVDIFDDHGIHGTRRAPRRVVVRDRIR